MLDKKTFIYGGIILIALALVGGGIGGAIGVVSEEGCTVAGINLNGEIITAGVLETDYKSEYSVTVSEYITSVMEHVVEKEDYIEATLVEIDSFGGSPVAAEEIANAFKRSSKPTIAVIRGAGVSAAYWAATGADKIYASKNSDVGSIGVSLTRREEIEKNEKEGLNFINITSAQYKNIGNPNVEITSEERELLQRDVNIIHENFVSAVSENRDIPVEEIGAIADGSSVLGEKALELNLIDEIGDSFDAKNYIEELIGNEARICWY